MKRSFLNSNTRRVSFRKWGNKSFSVFASLKALVKICTVSATYSFLVMPVATFAQPDTLTVSKNVDLDEVVISSPLAASTYSKLMRALVVITTDEISQMPVTTLQDLLDNLASVDIRQRGGHGVQADLMIRGGSFDQVLILLNGINITDPQTGHHNLNIPIDLESIERIEILQGPGTRVYGPGTFSGAINIITSTKGKNFAKVGLTAGQYGLIKSNASAAVDGKHANLFIATSSSKSDGYTQNNDFNLQNLFVHTNIEKTTNQFDFQVGYQDKAFGAQNFYTPRFPEQFEKTSTLFTSASYSKRISNITISPSVYFRDHIDRFELFRYQAPEWYNGHNYHNTKVAGSKLQLSLLNKLGRTRAGAEYRLESINSNVLGDILESPKHIRGFSDTTYTRGKSRDLVNVFADHTFYFKSIIISAGGLMAHSNQFGTNWNYGIDMSIRLWSNISFFSSFNNAIRYPTFTDLYYSGPTNQGNINLEPERANNYEVGLKHNSPRFNANLTLFHRRGKDVIDWLKEPSAELWTTTNHTQINTSGVEFFASINTDQLIPLVKSMSLGYHFMNSNKTSGELLSYYTLDYLRHKVTLGISHSVFKKIAVSWSANWQDRAGTYTHYPTNNELLYKPFLVFNLRTSYYLKGVNVFVDFNNLGNKVYFDLGNIPQSGRWISFGLNYILK